jgi:transposase InsO family protein
MRENSLNARLKRKFIPATNSNHGLPVCENLLNRRFHAAGPGEKWVSSYQKYAVTYLRAAGGWVYLTVILDLFDRKVIGWALSAGMETAHTTIPRREHGLFQPESRRWPVLPLGQGSKDSILTS